MILVLGEKNAGKSLILKQLQQLSQQVKRQFASYDALTQTVPTNGTNIVYLTNQNNEKITVQEVGGAMKELWQDYATPDKCHKLIFVVDIADTSNYSTNAINLINIAAMLTDKKSKQLTDFELIVAINKSDCELAYAIRDSIEHFLFLDDLIAEFRDCLSISYLITSCVTGHNIPELLQLVVT